MSVGLYLKVICYYRTLIDSCVCKCSTRYEIDAESTT